MQLSDIVTNQELSKRLKELGVKHKSHFVWAACENPLIKHFKESDVSEDHWDLYAFDNKILNSFDWKMQAFTASELMELMPDNYMIFKQGDIFVVKNNHFCLKCSQSEHITMDKNSANALAKMLIYLIENGLVEG
jgi:hypothetical protein